MGSGRPGYGGEEGLGWQERRGAAADGARVYAFVLFLCVYSGGGVYSGGNRLTLLRVFVCIVVVTGSDQP